MKEVLIDEGYFALKKGEIIKDGDEFLYMPIHGGKSHWIKVGHPRVGTESPDPWIDGNTVIRRQGSKDDPGCSKKMTEEQLEEIGLLIDKCDNYSGAPELRIPPETTINMLSHGLKDVRSELFRIFVENGGDPTTWDHYA